MPLNFIIEKIKNISNFLVRIKQISLK